MKNFMPRIALGLSTGLLAACLANASAVSFTTLDGDANLESGEAQSIFLSFVSGSGLSAGSFTISDSSISELLGNVNALPESIMFNGISIDNGASVVNITPSLPYSAGPTDSISFRLTGLGLGTYTMTFNTSGSGAISGQLSRVPAPGTLALLGIGMLGLGLVRRKNPA